MIIIDRNYLQNSPKYSPTPKQFCISGTISIFSLIIFKNKISKYFEILDNKSPKFSILAYRAWHIVNASLTFIITTIAQKILGWGISRARDHSATEEEKERALEQVKENGINLQGLPENLKREKEVVLEAVKQSGMALEHASEDLKKDREVILEAVKQSGMALQYASEDLKKDQEVVLEAVKQSGVACIHADEAIWDSIAFIFSVLEIDIDNLSHLPIRVREDKDFIIKLVKVNGMHLEKLEDNFKNDRDVVKAAIEQNKEAIKFASEAVRKSLIREKMTPRDRMVETWINASNRAGVMDNFIRKINERIHSDEDKIEILFLLEELKKDKSYSENIFTDRHSLDLFYRVFKSLLFPQKRTMVSQEDISQRAHQNSELQDLGKYLIRARGSIESRRNNERKQEVLAFLNQIRSTDRNRIPLYPEVRKQFMDKTMWNVEAPIHVSGFFGSNNQCWLSAFMHLLFTSSKDFDDFSIETPCMQFILDNIVKPFREHHFVSEENMLALRLFMNDKFPRGSNWHENKADLEEAFCLIGRKNTFNALIPNDRLDDQINTFEIDEAMQAISKGEPIIIGLERDAQKTGPIVPLQAYFNDSKKKKRRYELSSVSCLDISHYLSYNRVYDEKSNTYKWYRYDDQGDRIFETLNVPIMQEVIGLEEYISQGSIAQGGLIGQLEKAKKEITNNSRYCTYVADKN